jgi:TPR repeat protein
VKWYRKAAEQGHAKAQYNLGGCYNMGNGVAKDETQAVKWWRKAAEQGYAIAQHNLSVCYHEGCGVSRDYVECCKWTLLAAAQGDDGAARNLPFFKQEMTSEQIAEAQRLVREFEPRKTLEPGVSPSGQPLKP